MSEYPHPLSTVYLDQQTARVLAALPAAGAWDATPLELPCQGFRTVVLYFTYTGGAQAVNPAFAFRIDACPEYTGTNWFQMSLYASQPVVTGADTESDVQRESIEYGATGAAAETFVYGPVEIGTAVELIRVPAHETGDVATPGTLEILARFGM